MTAPRANQSRRCPCLRRIRSNTKSLALTSKYHFDSRFERSNLHSSTSRVVNRSTRSIDMSFFISTVAFLLLFATILSALSAELVGTPISASQPADNFAVPSFVIRYGRSRVDLRVAWLSISFMHPMIFFELHTLHMLIPTQHPSSTSTLPTLTNPATSKRTSTTPPHL